MNDEIEGRVKRIYAAVGAMSEEWNTKGLRVARIRRGQSTGVMFDFKGGISEEELSNRSHTLIHNIANLHDHLRKWARDNGRDESKVDEARRASLPVCLVTDLSNNDKHGYPPRDGGLSGRSPRLGEITRVLQLRGGGSSFAFSLKDGSVSTTGDPQLVVEAEVIDKDGKHVAWLPEIVKEAITAWESLFDDVKIPF